MIDEKEKSLNRTMCEGVMYQTFFFLVSICFFLSFLKVLSIFSPTLFLLIRGKRTRGRGSEKGELWGGSGLLTDKQSFLCAYSHTLMIHLVTY